MSAGSRRQRASGAAPEDTQAGARRVEEDPIEVPVVRRSSGAGGTGRRRRGPGPSAGRGGGRRRGPGRPGRGGGRRPRRGRRRPWPRPGRSPCRRGRRPGRGSAPPAGRPRRRPPPGWPGPGVSPAPRPRPGGGPGRRRPGRGGRRGRAVPGSTCTPVPAGRQLGGQGLRGRAQRVGAEGDGRGCVGRGEDGVGVGAEVAPEEVDDPAGMGGADGHGVGIVAGRPGPVGAEAGDPPEDGVGVGRRPPDRRRADQPARAPTVALTAAWGATPLTELVGAEAQRRPDGRVELRAAGGARRVASRWSAWPCWRRVP